MKILILLVVLFTYSCSSDRSNKFIGEWKPSVSVEDKVIEEDPVATALLGMMNEITLSLNKDGTFDTNMGMLSRKSDGKKWYVNGDSLYLEQGAIFSITDDNTLVIGIDDEMSITFEKEK